MSPEPYARALHIMVEKGFEPKKAVEKLKEHLEARGRLSLLQRIGKAFEKLHLQEQRKSRVVLSVARKSDAAKAEREAKSILKEIGGKSDDVELAIEDSLIGGWRLEGRGRLVDASFKKQLLELYKNITNADAPTQGRGPDRTRVGI